MDGSVTDSQSPGQPTCLLPLLSLSRSSMTRDCRCPANSKDWTVNRTAPFVTIPANLNYNYNTTLDKLSVNEWLSFGHPSQWEYHAVDPDIKQWMIGAMNNLVDNPLVSRGIFYVFLVTISSIRHATNITKYYYTAGHKKLYLSYCYNNFAKLCHTMIIFGIKMHTRIFHHLPVWYSL